MPRGPLTANAFVKATADAAASRFSEAFKRWRQLYESARAQLLEANRKSEMHGLSAQERKERQDLSRRRRTNSWPCWKEARLRAVRTSIRIGIWRRKASCLDTTFPRLPLYAYVPAVGTGGPKAAYLAACTVSRHR